MQVYAEITKKRDELKAMEDEILLMQASCDRLAESRQNNEEQLARILEHQQAVEESDVETSMQLKQAEEQVMQYAASMGLMDRKLDEAERGSGGFKGYSQQLDELL